MTWIVVRNAIVSLELNENKFISYYCASNTQHKSSRQKKKLFPWQCHHVKVNLLSEPFYLFCWKEKTLEILLSNSLFDCELINQLNHLKAPRLARNGTEYFNRSFRLIVYFSWIQWHGKRPNDEIDEREPKIETLSEGCHVTEEKGKEKLFCYSLIIHFNLHNM